MIACTASDNPVERIRHNLVNLRMPRALEVLEAVIQQLERGQVGAIEAIDILLAEEITVREGRRIKAALQMARLATIKTLTGFDFSFQPSLDRNRIIALASLDFVDRHEVVHFIGQSGTGKSHLAVALGVEAIRAGRSVYFCPLADIIDSLAKADREGRLRERIRYLCRTQLLIIDEIGYVTLGAAAGNLFFQLVNARYERGAMILTSNRGFAEWGQVFGDPVIATALLDRLLHHAVVVHIEGSSYRMRQHADLLPPVQQRGGDNGIAEHLAPLGEAAVAGQDHGAALVAGVDQLEEQVARGGAQGDVADLVDDQKLGAAEIADALA